MIKDNEEHYVDLYEIEKPVTVEDYKREWDQLEEEEEKRGINMIRQKLAKYKQKMDERKQENSDLEYTSRGSWRVPEEVT